MGPVEDLLPTRLFESLPARPPTPPKETTGHDLEPLPKQLTDTLRSLQTPPGFPTPSASSKDSTSRRKRVGFSSQAQYQDPPIYVDPALRKQQSTPVSRASSTSKPVKGILKPATTPNRLGPVLGEESGELLKSGQAEFAEMLESTLQQLAGVDRENRIDAYTMLFRGLKASSNLPDRIALQQKLDLFLQFIQRDLSAKSPAGSLDTVVITSAIKLLHTFLRHQGIASSIPNEFGVFLVDHCVRSFQDDQVPKEIVRHLMHAMFLQNFEADIMTSERVGRVVSALHDLESHMSAASIIVSRIHVYEKLIQQCPQQMACHSDWLQDLFTDMLSSTPAIRTPAIKLGLNAAFTLNADKRLVSKALDLLNLNFQEKKYVEHITERLTFMLKNTEDCVFVPKIWSAIALFIPKPDTWDYYKSWTLVFQSSLNHKSLLVKKEANMAWSRYTYRLFLDGRLGSKSATKVIVDPLLLLLTNKRKVLRDSVLGCARNFFYYACRPDMDPKTLDDIWAIGVAPLIQRITTNAREDSSNLTEAAALLTGLIESGTRRIWDQSRIADPALIKNEELPAIDPKWVRANSALVFELAGPLLEKRFAELSVPGSHSQKLWRAFVWSVASASSKDVKLHDDTAKFVAGSLTLLLAVWKNGSTSAMDGKPCSPSQFLDSVRSFIVTLIQGLGLLPNPFMDKPFIRSKEGKFVLQTSSTSRRPSKHQPAKRSPLHHLFLMVSQLPPGVHDDDALVQLFNAIFSPFFQHKSEKAQADLSRELLRLVPVDCYGPYAPWTLCATRILASLEESQNSGVSGSGGNLGPDIRDVVRVLERGLRSTPNLPWEYWLDLFSRLLSYARDETGVAGVAIAVVEPLATVLKDLASAEAILSKNCVFATIALVKASTHPRDKLAVDATRRRLWGTSNAGARQASFDPFDNLYKLLVCMMQKLYEDFPASRSSATQLLNELGRFFDRGNSQLVLRALVSVQEGLALWLEDKDHRVTRTDNPGLVVAIESLWQSLCKILVNIPAPQLQLDAVEPLFCAAFGSTHREIVAVGVKTWNQIYEHVDHIDYPERLKSVLESLGSSVDVARPGLHIPEGSNVPFEISGSQDNGNHLPFISPMSVQHASAPHQMTSRRSATPGSTARQATISSVRRKSKGRTPKTKLRHEDSQMQFAVVDSSPVPTPQESQLLTDRQKEVRERQRDTAAMFPALRSSPTNTTKKAQQLIAPSASLRAATPENEGGFDDCLTSTPTPRRGQSAPLPEPDNDISSSPPEPRSFPLLAELKSQTNRSAAVDDWHFSSSPIFGSPNPTKQTNPEVIELNHVDEQLELGGAPDMTNTVETPETVGQHALPAQREIIEEATSSERVNAAELPAEVEVNSIQPSQPTPSARKMRFNRTHMTPRSDNEDFVDAPSSPMPPTPSQRFATAPASIYPAPINSDSFNVSESFEKGLRNVSTARFEIALRSSQLSSPMKKAYAAYEDILPESPTELEERLALEASQFQDAAEVLDVIEVAGADNRKQSRGRPKKSRSGSASQSSRPSQPVPLNTQLPQGSQAQRPITPIDRPRSIQGNFENLSPGNGGWWRKRKQSFSSVLSSGGSKRARFEDVLANDSIQEEIPDSQPDIAAVHQDPSVATELQPAQDLNQGAISSIAGEDNTFAEHTIASQELPFAAEDEPVVEDQPALPSLPDDELVQKPESEDPDEEVEMPLDHTDYIEEAMADYTDDEEAVHSQLAREEEESASRPPSPTRDILEEEIAQVGAEQDEADATPSQKEISNTMGPAEPQAEPSTSNFDDLMDKLRRGLDILRATDLSREQVYQVEDVMFEMRRELLQGERRGRQ